MSADGGTAERETRPPLRILMRVTRFLMTFL
jgi:hypothetical protein